jgi:predicted homoserine dehydrogenase-like protein
MTDSKELGKDPGTSRREFLKNTGRIAATSALAAAIVPKVYAAGNDTIRIALIGCGGRGTGAAANALSVKGGPIKLVAMADVFEDKLTRSYTNLRNGTAVRSMCLRSASSSVSTVTRRRWIVSNRVT